MGEWDIVSVEDYDDSAINQQQSTGSGEWDIVSVEDFDEEADRPEFGFGRALGALREGTKDVARAEAQSYAATSDIYSEPQKQAWDTKDEGFFSPKSMAVRALTGLPGVVPYQIQEKLGEAARGVAESEPLKLDPEYYKSSGFWEDVVKTAPQLAGQAVASLSGAGLAKSGLKKGVKEIGEEVAKKTIERGAKIAGAGFMAGQMLGPKYYELIENGVDPDRAFASAVANAIVQGSLEEVGFEKITKAWKIKKPLLKRLYSIAEAAGTEGLTEYLQEYPDAATNIFAENPDKSAVEKAMMIADQWKEIHGRAKHSAKVGAFLGGTTAAIGQQVPESEDVKNKGYDVLNKNTINEGVKTAPAVTEDSQPDLAEPPPIPIQPEDAKKAVEGEFDVSDMSQEDIDSLLAGEETETDQPELDFEAEPEETEADDVMDRLKSILKEAGYSEAEINDFMAVEPGKPRKDPLTGIPESGYIRREMELAKSDPNKFIVMIDIDTFKAINDIHGHEQGDVVLQTLGEYIREVFGEDAVVGRYGGEEFAAVINRSKGDLAKVKQLLDLVGNELKVNGEPVTVSIGVAPGTIKEQNGKDRLYADRLLYDAKEGGRNQLKIDIGDGNIHTISGPEVQEKNYVTLHDIRELETRAGRLSQSAKTQTPEVRNALKRTLQTLQEQEISGDFEGESSRAKRAGLIPAKQLEPRELAFTPVADLKIDPDRFQYKLDTDEQGVTDALKGLPWKEKLAGVIAVWKDPADGEVYVINGHHRFALAQERGVENIGVRVLDAQSAEEAKMQGALINIAEKQGTPLDAAYLLREAGMTPQQLVEEQGVSLKGDIAKKGMGMAQLNDNLWHMIRTGELEDKHGAIIGEKLGHDPKMQDEAVKLVRDNPNMTDAQIKQMMNDLSRFGSVQQAEGEQGSLFDMGEVTAVLPQRAELLEHADKVFRQIASALRAGTKESARILEEHDNKIKAESNAEMAQKFEEIRKIINATEGLMGPIENTLNDYAEKLAGAKKKDKPAIKKEFLSEIEEAANEMFGGKKAEVAQPEVIETTKETPKTEVKSQEKTKKVDVPKSPPVVAALNREIQFAQERIEGLKKGIADWENREYKSAGGKQVTVGMDEFDRKSVSVDSINEKRRQKSIRQYKKQIKDEEDLIKRIESHRATLSGMIDLDKMTEDKKYFLQSLLNLSGKKLNSLVDEHNESVNEMLEQEQQAIDKYRDGEGNFDALKVLTEEAEPEKLTKNIEDHVNWALNQDQEKIFVDRLKTFEVKELKELEDEGYVNSYYSPRRPLNWNIEEGINPGAKRWLFTKEPLSLKRLYELELVPYGDTRAPLLMEYYSAKHGTDKPIVLSRKEKIKGKKDILKGAVIHKSTKIKDRWQVSYFDDRGFFGDTQERSLLDAVEEAIKTGYRKPDPNLLRHYMKQEEFHKGMEETRKRQKEWEEQVKKKESLTEKKPQLTKEESKEFNNWLEEAAESIKGTVVYKDAESGLALIEGYSILGGQPVYAGFKRTGESGAFNYGKTRVDIDSFTGKTFTDEELNTLKKEKAKIVEEENKLYEKNPDGPFGDKQVVGTDSVSEKNVNLVKGWLDLLGVKGRVFILNPEDIHKDPAKYKLHGKYAPAKSAKITASVGANMGGVRSFGKAGDYYIQYKPQDSRELEIEVIGHEVGHILEKEMLNKASQEEKNAIRKAFNGWLEGQKGKPAKDFFDSVLPKHLAEYIKGEFVQQGVSENATSDDILDYWKGFNEWFANNVSRWVTTRKEPVSIVEKFFSKIAEKYKKLVAAVKGEKWLPNKTVADWLNKSINEVVEINKEKEPVGLELLANQITAKIEVGSKVRPADRENLGTVQSIEGDYATVYFHNKAEGTEATVRFPLSELKLAKIPPRAKPKKAKPAKAPALEVKGEKLLVLKAENLEAHKEELESLGGYFDEKNNVWLWDKKAKGRVKRGLDMIFKKQEHPLTDPLTQQIARDKLGDEWVDKRLELIEQAKEPSSYDALKDEWFKEKDIKVHRNTVEAAKLQEEIKEIAGTKRFGPEAQDMDMAIHIYNDLKGHPDHLKKYYNQLSEEQKRIVDLSQQVEKNPRLKDIADRIAAEYKKVAAEAIDEGVIRNALDNYEARIWAVEGRPASESFRKFGTTTRHAKQRKFDTILEGWAADRGDGKKLDLKVKGATNNLMVYKDELARTIEDRKLISEAMKIKTPDGVPLAVMEDQGVPEGYMEIKHPNFVKWTPAGVIKEGSVWGGRNFFTATEYAVHKEGNDRATRKFKTLAEAEKFMQGKEGYEIREREQLYKKQKLYMPEQQAKVLNKILGKSRLMGDGMFGTAMKEITLYNALFKAFILQTSFFHHLAFARSYLLGVKGKKKGEWSPFGKAYKDGLESIKQQTPEIELLVKNGLTLGEMQDWKESMLREHDTVFGKMMDKLQVTKDAKEWLNAFRERQADFLFKKLGAGLKAKAALIEYRNLLQEHPEMEENERAKMVAKLINADFGGLHLGRLERSPTGQHVFRLLALAPDWTESNVRTMLGMYHNKNRKHEGSMFAGSKEEAEFYRSFWASVITKGMVATQLLNLIMCGFGKATGLDDEDFLDRFLIAWEAGKLRWLDVDITPIYRAKLKLMGSKDKDAWEARKYFSIFGHFKDPMKFGSHLPKSAKHKGSVLTRHVYEALSGEDWRGHRFTTLDELLGIDDKGRYKTTRAGKYRKGQQKGGKMAGQLTTLDYTSGGGPIEYSQMPSYFLSQIRGNMPIQLQELLGWISGEYDGMDALFRSLGIHISSYVPRD